MTSLKNPYIKSNDKPRKSFSKPVFYVLLFFIPLVYFLIEKAPVEQTTWNSFKHKMLLTHDVDRITVVNKEIAEIYLKKDSLNKSAYHNVAKNFFGMKNNGPHYYLPIGSVEVFEQDLKDAQLQFAESEKIGIEYMNAENNWLSSVLKWIVSLGVFALIWFFIMRNVSSRIGGYGRSVFDFGKSNPGLYEKGKNNPVTFKDVAGYEEAKTEVMEIVTFLKQPENFTKLGAKIPKGVLLIGAPGTGKTLMAKAIAGEAEVPFFSLSGSEFIEMFVGVGASRVRDLFSKAKQKTPSIIFIDEIDTIGRLRGKTLSLQANDERDSTLNQLLAEMDGFDSNSGIIVLAATNRADMLDPALLRSGRFDRHIHLDLPNKQERVAIFEVHLKPLLLDKSITAEFLASQTPGFSGADIANVCNEAGLIAARKKKNAIEKQDFFDAIDRIVGGLEKRSKIISPAERKIIAYHEAGHTLISWILKNVDPLLKVSIIPRGKSLGTTWYTPEERQIVTRAQFFDQLCASLGGRAAEEIIFNDVSSGALDDLEKVTKQAYMMITKLGLSKKIGNISFYDSTELYENAFQKPYSEATAVLIDDEVRTLVQEAYTVSKTILEKNLDKLNSLARLLLEKEVIYVDDMEAVLGKRIILEKPMLN